MSVAASWRKYPVHLIEVGETIVIPFNTTTTTSLRSQRSIEVSVCKFQKLTGRRFLRKKMKHGLAVTRIV